MQELSGTLIRKHESLLQEALDAGGKRHFTNWLQVTAMDGISILSSINHGQDLFDGLSRNSLIMSNAET